LYKKGFYIKMIIQEENLGMEAKKAHIQSLELTLEDYKKNALEVIEWIKNDIINDDIMGAALKLNTLNEHLLKANVTKANLWALKHQ
jgi:hypothetical protein